MWSKRFCEEAAGLGAACSKVMNVRHHGIAPRSIEGYCGEQVVVNVGLMAFVVR